MKNDRRVDQVIDCNIPLFFALPLITRDTIASVPAPFRFPVTTVIRYSDVIFSSPETQESKLKNK